MNKGKLIVIEGLDGSGKTTQFEKLIDYYKWVDYKDIVPISFPNYSNPSSTLVQMYLQGKICDNAKDINAYAASSFYAVDRYVNYKKEWEKDYNDGKTILAARYTTSNCIYQMTKLAKTEWYNYINWLEDYEYNRMGLPKPNKVIFLDMDVDVSQKLMTARYNGDESKKDIHECDVEFLKACRETALYTANKQNWNVIKCSENSEPLSIDTIFTKIVNAIDL